MKLYDIYIGDLVYTNCKIIIPDFYTSVDEMLISDKPPKFIKTEDDEGYILYIATEVIGSIMQVKNKDHLKVLKI